MQRTHLQSRLLKSGQKFDDDGLDLHLQYKEMKKKGGFFFWLSMMMMRNM